MQRTEIVAESLDESGHGVGRSDTGSAAGHGGKSAIHVMDLLPGERAEVVIDHASPHKAAAWGHVVRRLGPASPDRVAPACPAFGVCGGCVWQHLAYPAQLAAKHRRLARVLAAVPAVAEGRVAIAEVRPSAVLGYRNKGKYVAGRAGDHIVLGAYAPRSHHVIDTLGCRVVAPVIDEVATWVRGAAEAAGLVAYDEQKREGDLRYVIVRESEGDTMVALVVAPRTPRSKIEKVATALTRHPAIRSVVAIENDRRDGAIVPSGSSAQVLFGKGTLVEEIAGAKVEVGAGEFLQVNRAQATAMYTRIAELAAGAASTPIPAATSMPDSTSIPDSAPMPASAPIPASTSIPPGSTALSGTRAIDLFAGVGGIGLHLARAGATVVAVELDREATGQLRRAVEKAGLPLTALAGDASELRARDITPALGGPADVVVVNPPRKGLSATARSLLVELAAPTIIYVSCGPEALGRDLVELGQHGWEPDAIEPFDLMPGTAQVETIVRLTKVSR